jgi:hypothetical protein
MIPLEKLEKTQAWLAVLSALLFLWVVLRRGRP